MTGELRCLDLFSGGGGAAAGYALAGFNVVCVDVTRQPENPFEFIQADALRPPVDLRSFDLIHASPPCQAWTAYKRRPGHVAESPDLIGPTRAMLEASGVPYVIENIPAAPVRADLLLCGSMFGLDVRRHRHFETSFEVPQPGCRHEDQTPRFPPATNRTNLRSTVEIGVWRIPLAVQQAAMGIDWLSLRTLSESIPPAYTRYIGEALTEGETTMTHHKKAADLLSAAENLERID